MLLGTVDQIKKEQSETMNHKSLPPDYVKGSTRASNESHSEIGQMPMKGESL
jgi:hypothetical protein